MTVAWLREALQLGDTFQQMGSLKKFVIDVGVKQINDLSDITVSYKPVKTIRAITGFAFKVKSKDAELKKKKIVVNDKTANPGESYAAAKKRLEMEAAGQEKLL
jgi:plasmid replication initiation protein